MIPTLRLITGDRVAETRMSGARAGRGAVELSLPDVPTVSREHARFTYSDGQWWVANLGMNGMTLNGTSAAGEQPLHDGDVIFADERLVVAVLVAADDVLVFEPGSIRAAIGIAHALGNRHLPIQAEGDAIVVRYDPLLESLGAEHGVSVRREQRVITQPFRHAHAPHAHD